MWKLRQALEDRFGRNSTEIKCPIGWMVVLPDIVCPPLSPEFVRQEAIDASDMSGDIAARLAQAPSLLSAASQTGKIVPSEAVCRRIAEFLRPSFERVALESTRAWDAERKLIELSAEQFDVLEGLFDNDCVLVRGAAGTGKTVLALEAARRDALAGRKVLLTCFNRRLGDWLTSECRTFGPGSDHVGAPASDSPGGPSRVPVRSGIRYQRTRLWPLVLCGRRPCPDGPRTVIRRRHSR